MNNKFYPWAMPLQAPLPSQKIPSQPDGAVMTWEQYQAIKKKTADEVRKVKKSKSNRKSYHRMKNNEEKYKKNLIKKKKYLQTFRAAKKESIQKKKEEDAVDSLLSLGKEG
jgi:hypothetical protein